MKSGRLPVSTAEEEREVAQGKVCTDGDEVKTSSESHVSGKRVRLKASVRQLFPVSNAFRKPNW